ncbi:MAG: bile acid:sodium symporter [Labilithrix sp.]|nr:bile acid:sodium symporter [Labilithrix sp.]
MPPLTRRAWLDPYVLALLGTVALAWALPCDGALATALDRAADGAVALLFFLYGGRLAREVIVAGMKQWRVQLVVFLATFALFPLFGVALRAALAPFVSAPLLAGIVFLTLLPSTVQSSIAFTSIARGNIPAAICSATVSNLAGVVITPALVAVLLEAGGSSTISLDSVWKIVFLLLAPFAIGHALRPLTAAWHERNRRWLGFVDRGSILLVVYAAFSAGVVNGTWSRLPLQSLGLILAVSAGLLAAVMAATTFASRRLGFTKEDEIAVVFCGSKKSLASGLPMAKILFAGPTVGLVVLPLMIFHQLQLMVCAVLARRYAQRS